VYKILPDVRVLVEAAVAARARTVVKGIGMDEEGAERPEGSDAATVDAATVDARLRGLPYRFMDANMRRTAPGVPELVDCVFRVRPLLEFLPFGLESGLPFCRCVLFRPRRPLDAVEFVNPSLSDMGSRYLHTRLCL
jgi:hypothetical protein